MRNLTKAAWGVFFVLLGAALAGKALGMFDFNIYFPGWWTLFIIIPSLFGSLERGHRASSLFGLGLGIFLLLVTQGIINWYEFPRLITALIFITIGCHFIFRGDRRENNNQSSSDNGSYYSSNSNQTSNQNRDNESKYNSDKTNNIYNSRTSHGSFQTYYSFLSSRNVQFVDEVFTGAAITSILGNVQLDLRNAFIEDDVIIDTTCILGGIDIFVPRNVKVVVSCTPILGGVDSHTINPNNINAETRTIFIRGTCILGGVDVK
jgi:predicted membrane protein